MGDLPDRLATNASSLGRRYLTGRPDPLGRRLCLTWGLARAVTPWVMALVGIAPTQVATPRECVLLKTMNRDEPAETQRSVEGRWPFDLEVTVAKNIRWLREGRGITQQQLGSDLSLSGFGMHQMTVAQLEAAVKPLRLNEVAAIAAYFELPIEALWRQAGDEILSRTGDGLGAAQAADVEQMAADYYTQQRIERLRDK